MDANGTRYQLLLGYGDWAACWDVPGADADACVAGELPSEPPLKPVSCQRIRTLGEAWGDQASPLSSPLSSASFGDPLLVPLCSPHEERTTLAWKSDAQELTLRPSLSLLVMSGTTVPCTPEQRRGVGRDRYGNWYWIAESGTEILVHSAGSKATTHFWSTADRNGCTLPQEHGAFAPVAASPGAELRPLSGLAVTEDHYLVVGVLSPPELLVFDLHSVGAPQAIRWPAEVAFEPFDMAPRPGGGVFVLDRKHRVYWEFDRYFRPLPAGTSVRLASAASDFAAVSGPALCPPLIRIFPSGYALDVQSPVEAVDPIAIEALPDGTVLILDREPVRPFSRILRYQGGEQLETLPLDSIWKWLDPEQVADFHIRAHDIAFVAAPRGCSQPHSGTLYVVGDDGRQAFGFHVQWSEGVALTVEALPDFLPLRLFGRKALVAAGDQAYYDFSDRWVPLAAQKRPRYAATGILESPLALPQEGIRPAFDGRDPDCVWHRVMLDACIPPECSVQIWSRAANDQSALIISDWHAEPPLYRRGDGSELPFVKTSSGPHSGTWEVLLQRARGRFLQLRIQLCGNGRSTPAVRALRAYFPRFSYLQYLPAIYRDDGSTFLERFLANIEGTLTTTEDRIAAVQLLFDPDSAPSSALPWLAVWFELALDPQWDDRRRRLMIRHALKFFQYRGTARGIEAAVRLALDPCVDENLFLDLGRKLQREPSCSKRIAEAWRSGEISSVPQVLLGRRRPVRVTEAFRSRPYFNIEKTIAGRWKLSDGDEALHERWTKFRESPTFAAFPITPPADPAEEQAWRTFCRQTLGFEPAAGPADLPRWRTFLQRRYDRITTLNNAYQAAWPSFSVVPLPTQLPATQTALRDWYQFETVVLLTATTAHRFSVLLPAPRRDAPDRSEFNNRLNLARRVVALEKPAHTVFDVRFYWDYFRVGGARLGDDTVIDRGSRAAELNPAIRLGEQFVGASFLTPAYPFDVTDRMVAGRDRLGRGSSPTEPTRE